MRATGSSCPATTTLPRRPVRPAEGGRLDDQDDGGKRLQDQRHDDAGPWIGLGLRSGFLPGTAAALELGGSWRTGTTVLVLTAWAVAGLLAAPVVLRRMTRRQSGAQVAAARETAGQWIR